MCLTKNKLTQLLKAVFPWRRQFDAIFQKPEDCFNGQFTSNDCSYCRIKDQSQGLKNCFTQVNLILND